MVNTHMQEICNNDIMSRVSEYVVT